MLIIDIAQIVSTLGFPIAACIAMGWYVKYTTDKHSEEMEGMRTAVNNNTLLLQKLCDKLEESDKQ